MTDSRNDLSGSNAPDKPAIRCWHALHWRMRWHSLRYALRGLVLGFIIVFIKAFIYEDLPNVFGVIPILMGWFGVIYSIIVDSPVGRARREKKF